MHARRNAAAHRTDANNTPGWRDNVANPVERGR
jgi:hypothetical protein